MANRYKHTNIKKDTKTGKRMYGITFYPEIPADETDVYIYTKEGDRLDKIAYRYYRDTSLWWIIAQANHIGKGTLAITPGTRIRIPLDIPKIFNDLDKLQNRR